MLFRSGSFRSKLFLVYKATRQHARNLGLFALVYKSCMLLLKHTSPTGKERHYDAFLAGLMGGYTVFGRTIHNSVSQQIVIYVAARVCLALAKLAVQQRHAVGKEGGGGFELFGNGELRRSMARNGWPVFASLSWAMVMYIFRWHPESVQSSLRSSMSYMWVFCNLGIWMRANERIVMFSRMIGIRCGRWFGITNKHEYLHRRVCRILDTREVRAFVPKVGCGMFGLWEHVGYEFGYVWGLKTIYPQNHTSSYTIC